MYWLFFEVGNIAASGYMTETDTESIWDTTLDSTRFGKINVRIGEILNFWITGDASTDITDTEVTPILEQLSEEALTELIAASKVTGVVIPTAWLAANVASITMNVINRNYSILKRVQEVLYDKHIEIVSGRASTDYTKFE